MHNSLSSVQTAGLFVPPFVRPGRLGSGSGYDPVFSSACVCKKKRRLSRRPPAQASVKSVFQHLKTCPISAKINAQTCIAHGKGSLNSAWRREKRTLCFCAVLFGWYDSITVSSRNARCSTCLSVLSAHLKGVVYRRYEVFYIQFISAEQIRPPYMAV